MASADRPQIVILGAGPAGLGAAWKLVRRGCFDVTVVERAASVGGNAGSFELCGLRVDYGSHRLHPSCSPQILADIREMPGADLLDRPRHGRIRLRGRWVHFPLRPLDLLTHLPPSFLLGVTADALRKLGSPACAHEDFRAVLEAGLGRTICRDFYFPYAQKIWGVSPEELDAEQARRRVSGNSLAKMAQKVMRAIPGFRPTGGGRFYYPRNGFGSISEAFYCGAIRGGAAVRLGETVAEVSVECGRAFAVRTHGAAGADTLPACQVLSTIPVSQLARVISPSAPEDVLQSADALRFRSMILIYLVLETDRFTEYDAHYFPDAAIGITRLSEPKNYGLADRPGVTVLCAELPCGRTDAVWSASDRELGDRVMDALATAGLPVKVPVREIATRRLPQAYPIYTRDYRRHFDRIDEWLSGISGLVSFGRQGLFAHDNTHHALAMAYGLNECLDDRGALDPSRWAEYRREFQHHVVED